MIRSRVSAGGLTVLLVSEVALLALSAIDQSLLTVDVTALLFAAVLLATLWALGLARARLLGGSVLVLLAFGWESGIRLGWFRPPTVLQAVTPLAYALVVAPAIVLLYREVLSQRAVTRETLRGGIAVYVLIGLLWTLLFESLALFDPEAFAGGFVEHGVHVALARGEFLYFSLTTLTTLGYGDVVPVSRAARMLAVTEAMAGQVFVAVFIAGIVGRKIAQEGERR